MKTELQKQKQREATQRWRERNPDKVEMANRRPRHRQYNPIKSKEMRMRRLAKPGYRERINKQANDRAKKIRQWLWDYKTEHGCIDCGYKANHAALHFDHIRGKKVLNVCNAKSIAQAKQEITKCVVRCANCHFIQSFNRLQVRKSL